jgi:hypothetical protein
VVIAPKNYLYRATRFDHGCAWVLLSDHGRRSSPGEIRLALASAHGASGMVFDPNLTLAASDVARQAEPAASVFDGIAIATSLLAVLSAISFEAE